MLKCLGNSIRISKNMFIYLRLARQAKLQPCRELPYLKPLKSQTLKHLTFTGLQRVWGRITVCTCTFLQCFLNLNHFHFIWCAKNIIINIRSQQTNLVKTKSNLFIVPNTSFINVFTTRKIMLMNGENQNHHTLKQDRKIRNKTKMKW